MEWYKFVAYGMRNNPDGLDKITEFLKELIKKYDDGLLDNHPLYKQEKNNDVVIYFSSQNSKIIEEFINKYNAIPCDKPSAARAEGDGALTLIWGFKKS